METKSKTKTRLLLLALPALLLGGCAVMDQTTGVASIPCTYRFKMLTRPDDQSRVEAAIRSAALGGLVTKSGTVSYPEYRFRVARMADLDRLHPALLYGGGGRLFAGPRRQALNVKSAGFEMTLDSIDVSASAVTTVTFRVKPGSRLYYKDAAGNELDITARVDRSGRVVLPIALREGQKHIYARAVKDRVTRYIRINIFTNQIQDISQREYR